MVKRILLAAFLLIGAPLAGYAQTPSLNDLIVAYLKLNNIVAQPGDWNTCAVGNGPDMICNWNATDLGPEPSMDILETYATAAENIDQSENFGSIVNSGFAVTCASGDTVCTSAIVGTYTMQPEDLVQVAVERAALTLTGQFSNGLSTIDLMDRSGTPHTFTKAQFLEYIVSIQNYYAGLVAARDILATGASATYPNPAPLSSSAVLPLPPSNSVSTTTSAGLQSFSASLPTGVTVAWNQIANTPTSLSSYGISDVLTVGGDVSGSASLSGDALSLSLSASGMAAGTYENSATTLTPIIYDAKGRAIGTGTPVTISPAWSSITGKPTIPTAPLSGSASITGGSLLLGGCLTTATATISGASVGQVVQVTPNGDPGVYIANAWVSSANTVSVRVCAGVAETLATETWNIRVQ